MIKTLYRSHDEYVEQVVNPALGRYWHLFDTDAIAAELLEPATVFCKATKQTLVVGLVERQGVDFYAVADRHATGEPDWIDADSPIPFVLSDDVVKALGTA